jgi:hypothetical protein
VQGGPGAPEVEAPAATRSWRDVSVTQYRRLTVGSTIAGVLLLAWGMWRLFQTHIISGVLLLVVGFVVGLWTLVLRIEGMPAVLYESQHKKKPTPGTSREMWSPRAVHFYTRRECTLCEEARVRLEPVLQDKGITMVVHDVDKDPALRDRYGSRVPVAVFEGEELFALRYDEDAVRVVR